MIKFLLSILIFLSSIVSLFAQSDDEPNISNSYWSGETAFKWMSNYQPYGVEVNDGTTFSGSLGISHSDGFYSDLDFIYLAGISQIENWSAAFGYDYEINSIFSVSGEYSYIQYSSSTATVFSSLNHAISFSFDAELPWDISTSIFYDHYFGNLPASYYGISLSSFFKVGDFSLIPVLHGTMVSQSIETTMLKNPKNNKQTSTGTTKNVSGLSNIGFLTVIIYPITEQFKLTATPSFSITPNNSLTSSDTQFGLSLGIKYGIDF